MTLEDHVGDILSKARKSANLSPEVAAAAAGLSVADYAALESTGKSPKPANLLKLAPVLGLNGPKLEGIARGWHPPAIDLSPWRELRQIATTQGGNTVNCYLVWDEVSREAALFDTGWDAAPIFRLLDAEQLQLKHLFITHTHTDHIAALGPIRERFPKVKLHSSSKHAPVDQRTRANDFIHLGSLRITYRDTPGHAEDGATFIIGTWSEDAPHVAVVGDAIFAGSIGGAREQLALAREKIQQQIFSLPPDTLICPGHGPVTTVALEKEHNPFF